jgi:RNA polymerase sigma-70 factor
MQRRGFQRLHGLKIPTIRGVHEIRGVFFSMKMSYTMQETGTAPMPGSHMEKRMAQEIAEAYERCQRRYPTIQISHSDFHARIDEILLQDARSQKKAFSLLHHEDLFLAMACSRQDRIAWEYFADEYLPLLRKFSTQACGDPGEGEDLAQEITVKMLKEGNRLSGYNGRGSLAGWLRSAVAHAAIDRFRRARRLVSLEDISQNRDLADLINPGEGEGEEFLDSRWAPVVSNAVSESLSRLAARDRLVLILYYLRGVPLLAIGRQFRIHEATVSRWLDRLRRNIRKQVESDLQKKHGLRAGEIRSLWKNLSIAGVADSIAETLSPAPAGMKKGSPVAPASEKSARRKA